MKYFILILGLLVLSGCGRNFSAASFQEVDDMVKKELLLAHNKIRKEHNLTEFVSNDKLNMAAQKHANWMAANRKMSHAGKNRSSMSSRIEKEDYEYSSIGENIAYGQESVNKVISTWMDSSGHRKNILNKNFKHIGVGASKDGNSNIYWCVDFGSPE